MATCATADEVIRMARELPPSEKLKLIEQLTPDLESALASPFASPTSDPDEQYQRGYENIPEDTTDLEALLPHLPLPQERW